MIPDPGAVIPDPGAVIPDPGPLIPDCIYLVIITTLELKLLKVEQIFLLKVVSFIIKFQYNVRSHWFKQRAL